jgi:DNA-binding CsgD family transcriptional regulator
LKAPQVLTLRKPHHIMSKKLTHREKIEQLLLFGVEMHYKDVAAQTNIAEPTVRRELGQGAKKGIFQRKAPGVYTMTTEEGQQLAYIQLGKCEEKLPEMAAAGQQFDMVFLDPAYYSPMLIGRNRMKEGDWFNFITPEQFSTAMEAITAMMKTPDSHVYLMLSGAVSAQVDMNRYVDAATRHGLKIVDEGKYHKVYPNKGRTPVINLQGKHTPPERVILLTKSGKALHGEIPELQLDFTCIRPSVSKSYRTQKPEPLVDRLILQSTREGDKILDPSAGSGIVGIRSVMLNRVCHLIEASMDTISNYIVPKFMNLTR